MTDLTDKAWTMPIEDLAREAGKLTAAGTKTSTAEAQAVMQVLQARSAYESAVVNQDLVKKTRNLVYATWALVLATVLIIGATAIADWYRASDETAWLNYEACIRTIDDVDPITPIADWEQLLFLWRDELTPEGREERPSVLAGHLNTARVFCGEWKP